MKKHTKKSLNAKVAEIRVVNQLAEQIAKRNAALKVTLDDLDKANMDLHFIEAFVDMLFDISDSNGIDWIKSGTIASMCSVSVEKIESLRHFIDKVPVTKQKSEAA